MKTSISQTLELIERVKEHEAMIPRQEKQSGSGFRRKSKIEEAMNIEQPVLTFTEERLFTRHVDLYESLIKLIEDDKENESLNIYERELVSINKMQQKLFELFGIYSEKWVDILIKVIYLNNPHYFL